MALRRGGNGYVWSDPPITARRASSVNPHARLQFPPSPPRALHAPV